MPRPPAKVAVIVYFLNECRDLDLLGHVEYVEQGGAMSVV
jgi:hypothetical protein